MYCLNHNIKVRIFGRQIITETMLIVCLYGTSAEDRCTAEENNRFVRTSQQTAQHVSTL